MSTEPKVQPVDLSIASVWMLQPEYNSLRKALESRGYSLRDLNNITGPSIILATKGTVEVFTNLERRVVGVRSETSTSDVLAATKDIDEVCTELGIEKSNTMFHEFIGAFSATSGKNPMKTVKTLKLADDVLRKVGSILDEDIAMLGLNLTTKEGDPTLPEWLRLVVEPLYISPNKRYNVRVIYRGEFKDVVDFVNKIEKRVAEIIKCIEGST